MKTLFKQQNLASLRCSKQRGFTLVELMVALALSLLVVAASVSALIVSRQGFATTDAASQLRDNARFATDFITRLSVQSGFKDVAFVDTTKQSLFKAKGVDTDPDSPIFGFNNAVIGPVTDPLNTTNNSRDTTCNAAQGTLCANGSDILVMRYQTGSKNTESALGSLEVDNAMFNCAGVPQLNTPTSSSDGIESMLYVSVPAANVEPALMCKYKENTGTSWVAAATPLVQGVESFQVLYGTDAVVPGIIPVPAAPLGTTPTALQPDSIPDRYLRADQLTIPGNESATKENWRRVRSLRIGLVIRGPVGSAQGQTTVATPLTPLGAAFAKLEDKQTSFVPIPNTGDSRLRQVVTFTVYLHNYQGI